MKIYKYLFLFLLSMSVYSEELNIPPIIDTLIDYLNKQDYNTAKQLILDSIHNKDDSLYAEILYNQAILSDYESYNIDKSRFRIVCDSARKAYTKIDIYKRPIKIIYYQAFMEGALSIYRAKRKDVFGALTGSNVSKKLFNELALKVPNNKTVQYNVLLRDYYKFTITSKVGIGKKKINEIFSKLESVVVIDSSSSPLEYSEAIPLFWIYIDRNELDKAEKLSQQYFKRYPNSTIMLRGVVKLKLKQGDYLEAKKLGQELMVKSQERQPINWSDYFSGAVAKTIYLKNEDGKDSTISYIDSLLSIDLQQDTLRLEWVKKHRKSLMDIRNEINLQNN